MRISESAYPPWLTEAAAAFDAAGHRLYIVGGWVRNTLLALPPFDIDVASSCLPGQAESIFLSLNGFSVAKRDTKMGTIGVRTPEGEEWEYTSFRRESYASGGEHRPMDVSFGVPLEEDALRRDFTVNALYYDVLTHQLVDPLGGLMHLQARKLCCCRPEGATFADDGLRLLRLVRFAAELHFSPMEETYAQAKRYAALLSDVSVERIRGELDRILLSDTRYPSLQQGGSSVLLGLELSWELGLLQQALPCLVPCEEFRQNPLYHQHDVLRHLFHTCAAISPRLSYRLSALLHDVGKPPAYERDGNMYRHQTMGAEIAEEALMRLRYPLSLIREVKVLVSAHMYDLSGRTSLNKMRMFFAGLGEELSLGVMELRRADVFGSKDYPADYDPAARWRLILEDMKARHVPFSLSDLNIRGEDLLSTGVPAGPMVGEMLRELLRFAIMNPQKNNRSALLARAAQMIREEERKR